MKQCVGSPTGLDLARSLCRPLGAVVLKSTCAAGADFNISATSRLHFGNISATSRPHLGHISATSRPHLDSFSAGADFNTAPFVVDEPRVVSAL